MNNLSRDSEKYLGSGNGPSRAGGSLDQEPSESNRRRGGRSAPPGAGEVDNRHGRHTHLLSHTTVGMGPRALARGKPKMDPRPKSLAGAEQQVYARGSWIEPDPGLIRPG